MRKAHWVIATTFIAIAATRAATLETAKIITRFLVTIILILQILDGFDKMRTIINTMRNKVRNTVKQTTPTIYTNYDLFLYHLSSGYLQYYNQVLITIQYPLSNKTMLTSCNLSQIDTLTFSQLSSITHKYKHSTLTDRTQTTNQTAKQYHIYHQLKSVQRQMEFYKSYYQNDIKLKKVAEQIGEAELIQTIFNFKDSFVALYRNKQSNQSQIAKLFQLFRKQLVDSANQSEHSSNMEGSSYMSNGFEEKYLQLQQTLYEKIERIAELQRELDELNNNKSQNHQSSNFSQCKYFVQNKQNYDPNIFKKQLTEFKKEIAINQPCFETSVNIQQFQYQQHHSIGTQTDNSYQLANIIKGFKHTFKKYVSACNLIWKIFYKHVSTELDIIKNYQINNNHLMLWFSKFNFKSHTISQDQIIYYIDTCNAKSKYLDDFIENINELISFQKVN